MKRLGFLLIAMIAFFVSPTYSQDYVDAMEYSGNGMLLQKYRLTLIAENVANVSTHMTETGWPYRRKYAMVVPYEKGARIAAVAESDAPFGKIYDGSHVFSKDGYLYTPNFELNDEMVNLTYTNLVYEANATVFKSSRQMFQNTLELLK
ncbi:hypothetical protein HOH87_03100 [bacterium]|jgi:flagellar basal-body rod protein FlgC|nr:hypothetical protein [bacterium]